MITWMGFLEASVAGGICILLFSLVSQLCGERYRAKYKKVIWLLIALRLCIPISASLIPQPFTIKMPVYVLGGRTGSPVAGNTDQSLTNASGTGNGDFVSGTLTSYGLNYGGDMADTTARSQYFTSWDILIILWACGSIGVLLYYLLGHFIFYRKVLKESVECTDKGVLAAAIKMSKELGLKRVPHIRMIKKEQTGPFTVGFFRNMIVLPDEEYQEKDLQYIIKHELVHCADKDTQLKALFVAINAIHWFNPLVWLMKALVDQDMELECDEKVLAAASKEERNEYSEVLMSCIGTDRSGISVLSTGYVHGLKFIKKRFSNIFHTQKKSGKVAGCLIMALLVVSSGLVGFEAGRTVYAKSGIAIDCGIELRTDVTGDGVPDLIRVFDDEKFLYTQVVLSTKDGRGTHINYEDEMWSSSIMISGDLNGNEAADIVVFRQFFGMHVTGEPSVLYVTEGDEPGSLKWQRYPENFIHNSAIDMEQPDKFEDIACVGTTVIEKDGRHLLRLIALDMEVFDDETVQCIDCSWQGDGWYIEDMWTVTNYQTDRKFDELLGVNTFY